MKSPNSLADSKDDDSRDNSSTARSAYSARAAQAMHTTVEFKPLPLPPNEGPVRAPIKVEGTLFFQRDSEPLKDLAERDISKTEADKDDDDKEPKEKDHKPPRPLEKEQAPESDTIPDITQEQIDALLASEPKQETALDEGQELHEQPLAAEPLPPFPEAQPDTVSEPYDHPASLPPPPPSFDNHNYALFPPAATEAVPAATHESREVPQDVTQPELENDQGDPEAQPEPPQSHSQQSGRARFTSAMPPLGGQNTPPTSSTGNQPPRPPQPPYFGGGGNGGSGGSGGGGNFNGPPNPNAYPQPSYSGGLSPNQMPFAASQAQYNQLPLQRRKATDTLARVAAAGGIIYTWYKGRKLNKSIEQNKREANANFADLQAKQVQFNQDQRRQDREMAAMKQTQERMAASATVVAPFAERPTAHRNTETAGTMPPQNANQLPKQQAERLTMPPIAPTEVQQATTNEQNPGLAPDQRVEHSAWHNIVVNNKGEAVTDAIQYGEGFQRERQQEVIRDRMADGAAGSVAANPVAGGAQPGGYQQPQHIPGTLPSGMITPGLPKGTYTDSQHQLPPETPKPSSAIPGPVFWVMLVIILAAFFAAALI